MPKNANQKLKLMYIAKYLNEQSNESHPKGIADIIAYLAAKDIPAERKSIYDDIETLRFFGMDIIQSRSKTTGYYVGERDFELPELRLLVDSIQFSKFVPVDKSMALIAKIEGLTNIYDAKDLHRQVYVLNRVKTLNESIYYNIDRISSAINQDHMIQFMYFEYTVSKQRRFRKDGEYYHISPFSLVWDDENYYMVGWDSTAGVLKHFRVDKMQKISELNAPREGSEYFQSTDVSSYSQKFFGMFGGRSEHVKMRFADHLVGAVIDRFGSDIMIAAEADGHFTITVDIEVSPQFYAWLFGFGANVEVLSPNSVRAELKKTAAELQKLYE